MWKVLIIVTLSWTHQSVVQAIENGKNGPITEVLQGKLQGKYMETPNGRKFSAFTSIPFAKPPIGSLRFKPPVPADGWNDVLNATGVHADCPQQGFIGTIIPYRGDENCLYLNVYTPKLPEDKTKTLFPVMIFIHGGGWWCGGGNTVWYGPEVLLDKDIVLVVMNYRLGALGFLSTGDEVSPGNNGLKDQNLAIKWVRDNIESFGGNPDQITLFGESAGSASVQYHMLSPLSKGLFNFAISQSGTIQNSWALAPNDEAIQNGKKLAESLNCPTDSSEKMVECLRKIHPKDILDKDFLFNKWGIDPIIPFKPVIEPKHAEAFLDKHPIDLVKTGKIHAVPWMVGLNTAEGAVRVAGIFSNSTIIKELNDKFDEVIPTSLMYETTAPNKNILTKKIREFYFGDKKIDESQKSVVVNLYTDAWFLEGIDESVRLHKKHTKAPIYYYLFGYRGTLSSSGVFGDPERDYGVCHADELLYLFPVSPEFGKYTPSSNDIKMVQILTSLWTNFAQNGNPTHESNDKNSEKWTPIRTDDLEYYFIDAEKQVMKKNFFKERRDFWRDLPISVEKTNYKDEF